jgi:hypothetical protein
MSPAFRLEKCLIGALPSEHDKGYSQLAPVPAWSIGSRRKGAGRTAVTPALLYGNLLHLERTRITCCRSPRVRVIFDSAAREPIDWKFPNERPCPHSLALSNIRAFGGSRAGQ